MKTHIKEIFESIQGEGLNVGEKEVFVRFTGCNLACAYCDTYFSEEDSVSLNEEELFDLIRKTNSKTISLTGGEPLLHADFLGSFLSKYKKFLNKKVFLETNGTLPLELKKVIDYVDEVGMDIKIQSATGQEGDYELNSEFLDIAKEKAFIKVVFTKDIEDYEIEAVGTIAKDYSVPLVIQPVTPLDGANYMEIFNKFYSVYENVRLIPQTHTFLNLD